MVLDHIEKKHLEAVKVGGKYIIAKLWLVDFLAGDTAFEIVNKSNWHINTILKFKKNRYFPRKSGSLQGISCATVWPGPI